MGREGGGQILLASVNRVVHNRPKSCLIEVPACILLVKLERITPSGLPNDSFLIGVSDIFKTVVSSRGVELISDMINNPKKRCVAGVMYSLPLFVILFFLHTQSSRYVAYVAPES